jgi:hypothetical protein
MPTTRGNRILATVAVAVGLLAGASSVSAGIHGGFNKPSEKLEIVFKIAGFHRAADPNGCWPAPAALVDIVRKEEHLKIGVAKGDGAVHRIGKVFVIKNGTDCNHLRLAIRAREGLYILDSDEGPVQPPGRGSKRNTRGHVGNVSTPIVVSKDFKLTGPNETQRTTVNCPGRTAPLGGGMTTSPPVAADGEGIYPHSFERLGVQRGFHISATLIDPSPPNITSRTLTLQAICASGIIPATPSPHKTVFIKAGQTKSVSASCPKGQVLFSGGFQRTNFRNFGLPDGGGDWITESRATGPRTWRVTGQAFGRFGGEITAIALCVAHKGALLQEVSNSASVPQGGSATATTPSCPSGRSLTSGGFSMNGSPAFFAGGAVTRENSFAVTGYGYFGGAPQMTAYGYCMRA